MKTVKTILLVGIVALLSLAANAQKINVESGDLGVLSSSKSIKLEYNYDGMAVGSKYKDDKLYVADKKADAKDAEKAAAFEKGWYGARAERYEPKFEELFNKTLEKAGVIASKTVSDSKYTIVVKTVKTEPGFNIGVAKQPSFVDFKFIVYETGSPDKVVAVANIYNVVGSQYMGYDFDAGSRIAESYAKAGKEFGNYLAKKVF
ncbi:MAG: hypothetical protein K2Q22_16745 [Cytophagales bacterium]|nr:hypothetical protein [Cytophagales bacterium]